MVRQVAGKIADSDAGAGCGPLGSPVGGTSIAARIAGIAGSGARGDPRMPEAARARRLRPECQDPSHGHRIHPEHANRTSGPENAASARARHGTRCSMQRLCRRLRRQDRAAPDSGAPRRGPASARRPCGRFAGPPGTGPPRTGLIPDCCAPRRCRGQGPPPDADAPAPCRSARSEESLSPSDMRGRQARFAMQRGFQMRDGGIVVVCRLTGIGGRQPQCEIVGRQPDSVVQRLHGRRDIAGLRVCQPKAVMACRIGNVIHPQNRRRSTFEGPKLRRHGKMRLKPSRLLQNIVHPALIVKPRQTLDRGLFLRRFGVPDPRNPPGQPGDSRGTCHGWRGRPQAPGRPVPRGSATWPYGSSGRHRCLFDRARHSPRAIAGPDLAGNWSREW